jgi:hypothetical protein
LQDKTISGKILPLIINIVVTTRKRLADMCGEEK